jgi:hypothetical protein
MLHPNFMPVEHMLRQQYERALISIDGCPKLVEMACLLGMIRMANNTHSIPEFRIRYWRDKLQALEK